MECHKNEEGDGWFGWLRWKEGEGRGNGIFDNAMANNNGEVAALANDYDDVDYDDATTTTMMMMMMMMMLMVMVMAALPPAWHAWPACQLFVGPSAFAILPSSA